jgi:hypothetical protein
LRLPVHIVGGRGDDGVRGDAFGVPAKAKKKTQTGDPFAGPTRSVDFCSDRHFKISLIYRTGNRSAATRNAVRVIITNSQGEFT